MKFLTILATLPVLECGCGAKFYGLKASRYYHQHWLKNRCQIPAVLRDFDMAEVGSPFGK